MAAKKAQAPAAESAPAVPEPGISPELLDARAALLQAEKDAGLKDAKGALIVTETEPGIDPALVEARKKALEAEKNRKTF